MKKGGWVDRQAIHPLILPDHLKKDLSGHGEDTAETALHPPIEE